MLWSGGPESNRRHHLGRVRLSHLTTSANLVPQSGFEPETSRVEDGRSIQLSYQGKLGGPDRYRT